jgi:hypothetical protein
MADSEFKFKTGFMFLQGSAGILEFLNPPLL